MARQHSFKLLGILVLTFLVTASGCGLFGWFKGVSFKSNLKLKITVAPFVDLAGAGGASVAYNTARLVTEKLAKSSQLVIVPWSKVEAYMQANGIPLPLTQNTAALVGRALGLNAIVLGTVNEISQVQKRTGWKKWLSFIFDNRDYITTTLSAKAVDVAEGTILGARIGSGEIDTGQTEEELWMGNPTGGIEQAVIAASVDEAVEGLAENILKALAQARWRGFVIKVSGKTVFLGAGRDVGIRPGDRFVIHSGREKITNAAGQTYTIPGPVKAQLEATQVMDVTTEVRVVSGDVMVGEAVTHLD